MGREIKADCAEIKSSSNKIKNNSDELNDISNELEEIKNTIDNYWKGIDSTKFKDSLTTLTTNLRDEVKYLETWTTYLSSSVDTYVDNVEGVYSRLESINTTMSDIKY